MSVTFYPAVEYPDGSIRMAARCNCQERFCIDWDIADSQGLPHPSPYSCDVCSNELNLASAHACDLLAWIGLPREEYGHARATELAAKCRRRLWDEPRNHDAGIDGYEHQNPGQAKVIFGGRRDGYLREKTELLLKVCEAAGDRLVAWG